MTRSYQPLRSAAWFALALAFAVPSAAVAGCPATLAGAAQYTGPGSAPNVTDVARAVAVDASGAVYVLGQVQAPSGFYDWGVRKYSADLGTVLASTMYNGAIGADDLPWSLTITAAGEVIAVGSEMTAANTNWRVIKWNANLTTILATTMYSGSAGQADEARAVAVDSAGSILVAGSETNVGGSYDWRTIKWDGGLTTVLGSTGFTTAGNFDDEAFGMALDPAGSPVIVGHSYSGGTGRDWRVIKYNPGLTVQLGTTSWDGGLGNNDFALAVAVGSGGSVFVGGYWAGATTNWHVTKLNANLSTVLAAADYIGPGSSQLNALALDGNGNLLALGTEFITPNQVWKLVKYSGGLGPPLGATIWTSPITGSTNANAVAWHPVAGVVAVGSEVYGPCCGDTGPDWRIRAYRFPGACFDCQVSFSPSPAYAGQTLTVRLTVTNQGGSAATGATASAYVDTFQSAVGSPGASVPPGPLSILAGGSTTYVWTVSTSLPGSPRFCASVYAVDASDGRPAVGFTLSPTALLVPAGYQTAVSITPALAAYVPGQVVTIAFSASNMGDAGAASTCGLLTNTAGGTLWTSTSPASQCFGTLAAHTATTFVWTYTISGTGPIRFTLTVAGTDLGLGTPIEIADYRSLGVISSASLYVTTTVAAGTGPTTDRVSVRVSVQNIGGSTAINVVGQVWRVQPPEPGVGPFSSGGGSWSYGSALLESGPIPAGGVTILPGATQEYVFVYAVTGHGEVQFGGSAVGTDTGAGGGIFSYGSALTPISFWTRAGALSRNLPATGKLQIRNGVIRVAQGDTATFVGGGNDGSAAADLQVYSRAGLPLGKPDLGVVAIIGKNEAWAVEWNGAVGGKPLATGMYWVVWSGKDRRPVMVVNGQ